MYYLGTWCRQFSSQHGSANAVNTVHVPLCWEVLSYCTRQLGTFNYDLIFRKGNT